MSVQVERFTYDEAISRLFVAATIFWGAVAMLVGVFIAMQLANPTTRALGLPPSTILLMSTLRPS